MPGAQRAYLGCCFGTEDLYKEGLDKMNLIWNGKNDGQGIAERNTKIPVELQLREYIRSVKEEGQRGESKEAYAARIYAKAYSGQKLTPDEMRFLARTNPELYHKVLRAQAARRELERRLRNCSSKQEAQEVFADAISSVSEKDPDRDMILQALRQAFREFTESGEYQKLPENKEEAEKEETGRNLLEFVQNESGYQETYLPEEDWKTFEANA